MKRESPISTMTPSKEELRTLLKEKRGTLTQERRLAAYADLNRTLLPLLKPHKAVLSFYSISDEIDLRFLNQMLAEEGKLHLPKVEEGGLQLYCVDNPIKQLCKSKWGLWEPDPALCALIDIASIDCILVPGLGFDIDNHRIGYGKGHYDRLLAVHSPKTIGVGFKEQFCLRLPIQPHDVALDELKLF